jgi:hypothetical protein
MKNKTVVIHQPYFMPWLGFFDKIAQADIYIVLDNVWCDYKSKSVLNRNKIKTPQGGQWLTVPVKGGIHQLIKEVEISYEKDWPETHLKTLFHNYKKGPSYQKIVPFIEKTYAKKYRLLVNLNHDLNCQIFELLQINPKIVFASDLKPEGQKSDLIIDLLKKAGADSYLSGVGAKDYLDEKKFKNEGIELLWQDFKHPVYPQLWGEFIPNLSVIDYLFNKIV